MQAPGPGAADSPAPSNPNATLSAALAALASVQQPPGSAAPGAPSTNGAPGSHAPGDGGAPEAEGHEPEGDGTAAAAAVRLQLGGGGDAFKPPAASVER